MTSTQPIAYGEFWVDQIVYELGIRQRRPYWPCFPDEGVVCNWSAGEIDSYRVKQAKVLCALLNCLRRAVESGQAELPSVNGQ